jgi:predicted HicB family RNase H-like nuclease
MGLRTSFLLRCSDSAAETIREKAKQSRRSISGYVLGVLDRSLHMEEILAARTARPNEVAGTSGRVLVRETGAETAILVRCTAAEADRVRAAAKRRDMSISAFVMNCLRRSWNVETEMLSATGKTADRAAVAGGGDLAVKTANVSQNPTAATEAHAAPDENAALTDNSAENARARAAKSGAS